MVMSKNGYVQTWTCLNQALSSRAGSQAQPMPYIAYISSNLMFYVFGIVPFFHRYLVSHLLNVVPNVLHPRPICHPPVAVMADLYPPSYANRQHQSYHNRHDTIQQQQQQQSYNQLTYPSQPVPGSGHSGSSNDSSEDVQEPSTTKAQQDSQPTQKSESKPQATFLTKLYA